MQYESGFDFSFKHNISVSQLVKGHNSAHKSCAHFCGDTEHFSQLDHGEGIWMINKEYYKITRKQRGHRQKMIQHPLSIVFIKHCIS